MSQTDENPAAEEPTVPETGLVGAEPSEQSPVPDEARHRWTDLAEQIRGHRFAYYVRDTPTISDGEFDA